MAHGRGPGPQVPARRRRWRPGRRIADELGLPFGPFPDFLRGLKDQQIVAYTNTAAANDYHYTPDRLRPGPGPGLPRGVRLRRHGPRPVRRLRRVGRRPDDRPRAAQAGGPAPGLLRPADLRGDVRHARPGDQLGHAACSSTATRATARRASPSGSPAASARRSGSPGSINIEGQILKLFDPANHEPIEHPARRASSASDDHDDRWVEIRRPTIVAGGELTMDSLEIYYDPSTKISEAPLADEEQQRHLPDRRLRPPADGADRAAQPLDRPAGEALRLPPPAERQEDPRPVRPAHPLLDEPGAEAPRRRGVPPPDPLQDQRRRPDRGDVPPDVRDLRPQARLRDDRPRRRSTT